jgi:hypothetical protein
MSQLFTTDLLPASDRIDAWQWNAQLPTAKQQIPRAITQRFGMTIL